MSIKTRKSIHLIPVRLAYIKKVRNRDQETEQFDRHELNLALIPGIIWSLIITRGIPGGLPGLALEAPNSTEIS